jgi:hypothetical protein
VIEEDVYICPAGEKLVYHYTTEENGLALRRYWTNACQSCAIKAQCTDSDHGREIAVSIDPWLSSAMGQFHRGLSLVLVILAGLITGVELVRHHHGTERWILSAAVLMVALLAVQRVRDLRPPA